MGRPILFFISRPTSDVITSFRVEPIYYIETCSSRSSSIFSSTLIYGAVFPFPGGNRALARSNNYVHAMGPTYVGKSIASFGSYNDFDIMLESYRFVPPSGCNSAKNEALHSNLPSLLQEDVEKGWCKQCRINYGADGARAEGPPSRTYFYDNVSW